MVSYIHPKVAKNFTDNASIYQEVVIMSNFMSLWVELAIGVGPLILGKG
jgi:hypothetical protein